MRAIQAAFASAGTFAVGAALPLVVLVLAPLNLILAAVSISSLVFLSGLGALSAKVGGAGVLRGAFRVTFWGALAMALTAGIGALFGVATA